MYSNVNIVLKNAKKYLGDDVHLMKSNRKDKKFMVQKPNGSFVSFGQIPYKDFTLTHDENKRKNYLKRTANIKGDWKKDKYSPNNLSRSILWQ